MRLSEFIQQHRKKIMEEWVEFARTLLPWSKGMSEKELRDHGEELLTAVVSDMESPQSSHEQSEKSKGRAAEGDLGSVGHKHATERLQTGFKLDQLVAEYRALRASVLRLWGEAHGDKQGEITRFNEAIDETLAQAAVWYSEEMNHTREQFLDILGHDLRNPLTSIVMGATSLTNSDDINDKQARVAGRILKSAGRMSRMVSDLLDLTRTRLGAGIPVTQKPMDLVPVCQQVIAELEGVHPDIPLRFESKGELVGEWDSDRITQVVSNLVANALQYGGEGRPVSVVAQEHGDEVVLRVLNEGVPIPENAITKIFDPMVRQSTRDGGANNNATGLGLGLYIAREIVTAHGGSIAVTSTEKDGTAFTVKLPRHPPKRRRQTD